MTRHSKQSTNNPYFTYSERQRVDAGTKRKRIEGDDLREYKACHLCLQEAVAPCVCTQGHLYCRECIVQNILDQKKRYKVAEEERKVDLAESQRDKKKWKEAEREEALLAFTRENDIQSQGPDREDKTKLPSFWVPSVAPRAEKSNDAGFETIKYTTSCFATDPPHPISFKKLTPVTFARDGSTVICPSCQKQLRNASKPTVLTKCSHTACRTCLDQFILKAGKCAVCDAAIKAEGWIEIKTEGTGFAAGGKVIIEKKGQVPEKTLWIS